jgi:hypothetical protein
MKNIIKGGIDEDNGKLVVDAGGSTLTETLHDTALRSIDANPKFRRRGLAAQGLTDDYDRNREKANESIKKAFFKNDNEGYEQFLASTAANDFKQRNAMVEYEQAQVLHGLKENQQLMLKNKVNSIVETMNTEYGAAKLQQASLLEDENTRHANAQAATDDKFDTLKESFEKGETTQEQYDAGVKACIEESNAESEANRKNIEGANNVFAMRTGTLFQGLQNSIVEIYDGEYEFHIKMGESEYAARNAARVAAKSAALESLQNLINSGYGEFVNYALPILKDDETIRVYDTKKDENGNVVKDKDGNEEYEAVKGVFDISKRMFLSRDEIVGIEKALAQHATEERTKRNLVVEQYKNQLKQIVYNAEVVIDAAFDPTKPMDENAEKELSSQLQNAISAIYRIYDAFPEATGNHRNRIVNYYKRARNSHIKAMNEANNCANEDMFRKLLDSYDSDTQATHVVKVPLADKRGNVVETEMEMDGHKAFRTIYSLAKRAGYFKNGEYDAAYRRHTDPYARAQRIQTVINKFYDTKKSGKSATFAGVVLDVRRDGSIGIVNTKKETVGELDDALKNEVWGIWDKNLTIPYDVVRSVVNQLDDFCNRALVTPTEEQLAEKLREAYESAMDAHDNAAFNANFLNGLSRSIEAQFNPVVNEEVFGDARAKRKFLEKRGLEVSPDLIEKTENGRIRADFTVIEASIKPKASMYKRNIMQGTTAVDDRDFMAIAEE